MKRNLSNNPKKTIDFSQANLGSFEYVEGMDLFERAAYHHEFLQYLRRKGHLNYHLESLDPVGPVMRMMLPGHKKPSPCVCLVSNDYLGFSQYPKVKVAHMEATMRYGVGAGASPAIGGDFSFHGLLRERIAGFYSREDAILYTTGYTANSATLQCLLTPQDIVLVDSAVHASVYEGIRHVPAKRFQHNNMDMLGQYLKAFQYKYCTKLVVVDGVYSQDGDRAPLGEIVGMAHYYGAYVMLDDAHGVGVVGKNGRGVIETNHCEQDVDVIMGTFSKALGHIGGYVVGNKDLIELLRYQSRQYLFSTAQGPGALSIVRALELIDEEPEWRNRLWKNIAYLKDGLHALGLDTGLADSAIIPVKIGDIAKTLETGRLLLRAGVYGNPIMYPAVAKKDARIRLNVMATHTQGQLDTVLNAFEHVKKKLDF